MRRFLFLAVISAHLLYCSVSADIKVIDRTATTLEWDLSEIMESGKRYSVEILLETGVNRVRIIDEPLTSKTKTYKARNLKSNKLYILRLYAVGAKGEDIFSRPEYTNLRCYQCNGAASSEFCTKIVECKPGERRCQTRVKFLSDSRNRFEIYKGCKPSADVCLPNKERQAIVDNANSVTGELTTEQILDTMPGLAFFGDVDALMKRSPALLKQVTKKFDELKKNKLETTLKERCNQYNRNDEDDFCRCCCAAERCNHAMLDCGRTDPPELHEPEPLPPDVATPPPEVTMPVLETRKVPPPCRVYNGGCDHVCNPVNRTAVTCDCFEGYTLQDDGETCKADLMHAVADAGPDITITLPRNFVTISANRTLGDVKYYAWWDPVALGDGASLFYSDLTERDVRVTDLTAGKYKFVVTVTGMDGRRTTDMMTLTVNPSDGVLEEPKSPKVVANIFLQNKFSSAKDRDEWHEYVRENGVTTEAPLTTRARLRFTTKRTSFNVIKRPGRLPIRPTLTTTTTKPTTKTILKPSKTTRGGGTSAKPSRKPGSPGTSAKPSGKPGSPGTSAKPGRTPRGGARNGKNPLKKPTKGKGQLAKPKSVGQRRNGGKRPGKLRMVNARPKPMRTLRTRQGKQGARQGKGKTTQNKRRATAARPATKSKAARAKPVTATKPATTTKPTTTSTTTTKPKTTTATTTERTPPPMTGICPALSWTNERRVIATCTNTRAVGSKCALGCQDGRILKGADSVTCRSVAGKPSWVLEQDSLPCCEVPCPSSAYADVIFLIHSTNALGKAGWTKMTSFVNSVISKYTIGKDNVCVGAVRYNRQPDVTSEIKLDCSRTKFQTRRAIEKLPFSGAGTNTGAGLKHLLRKSFKSPDNRPNAQDVAVVITDAKSMDDVIQPAKDLKRAGVKIQVIGIKTTAGTPNLPQLKSMATNPAKTVTNLFRLTPAAPPSVEMQMRDLVCPEGCQRYAPSVAAAVELSKNS